MKAISDVRHFLSTLLIVLLCIPTFSQKEVTNGPENGALLIMGGAIKDRFYNKFMELSGGPDAPVVFIPTAQTSNFISKEDQEEIRQRFLARGFNDVTVLHTRDRDEANSPAFYAPIERAKGVWFSGGRQWRHADSYLHTETHKAIERVLDRGGVIAGSSAGATIQGSYLARGDTRSNTIMSGDHEEGMGFITNIAIDQHLFTRNRQFDMFEILDVYPHLLGIGIDENTGIIVRGNRFRVLGESYVVIYDGTRWSEERDTIYQLENGSREFYLLGNGRDYDLLNRKVVQYKDRNFINLTPKELEEYTGVYHQKEDDINLEITLDGSELILHQKWNDRKYQIEPETKEYFYGQRFQIPYDFKFENGRVVAVDFAGEDFVFTKILN